MSDLLKKRGSVHLGPLRGGGYHLGPLRSGGYHLGPLRSGGYHLGPLGRGGYHLGPQQVRTLKTHMHTVKRKHNARRSEQF